MSSEAVKVVVRVRPINEKERLSVCKIAVEVDEKNNYHERDVANNRDINPGYNPE